MDIEVGGTRLHVIDEGSGHAVLFLHGMGCDGTDCGHSSMPSAIDFGSSPSITADTGARFATLDRDTRSPELAAAINGARLEIVPDAGHFSILENPAFVNQLLAKQFEHPCNHGGNQ